MTQSLFYIPKNNGMSPIDRVLPYRCDVLINLLQTSLSPGCPAEVTTVWPWPLCLSSTVVDRFWGEFFHHPEIIQWCAGEWQQNGRDGKTDHAGLDTHASWQSSHRIRAGRHDGCGSEHSEVCERHEREWLLTRGQLEALSEASTFLLSFFIMEVPAEFNPFYGSAAK